MMLPASRLDAEVMQRRDFDERILVSDGAARTLSTSERLSDAASTHRRIASLDFVKGLLVLLMVVYHWLNYFIGLQWEGYRYLRFLTPGFIFITGLLVSRVYLQRYSYEDPQLHRRLALRGFKLLALFIGLNVLVDLALGGGLVFGGSDLSAVLRWSKAILVDGRGRAAFDILVPIAYFLLLAPLVLLTSRRLHISLSAVAAISVLAAWALNAAHRFNPHIEIMSFALIGLAAGAHPSSRINATPLSPLVVLTAYCAYLLAITLWNVPYLLQVVGVPVNVLLLSTIAAAWGTDGTIQRCVVRLGQYSLLSYITQIAVLQLLRRRATEPLDDFVLYGSLAATLAVTIVIVESSIGLRSKSVVFDRVYRMIFA